MFLFVLAFLAGDLYLQTFAHLPVALMIDLAIAAYVIFFVLCILQKLKRGYLKIMMGFLLGFLWSAWYASNNLSWSVTHEMENHPMRLRGVIASLPVTNRNGVHFEFVTQQSVRVRLSWRQPVQPLRVGDEWFFTVRLKRMHGLQSPGAFDFEAWALQKKLRAVGYIAATGNQFITHKWYNYPVNQLRQQLQEKITQHLPLSNTAPWLLALMIGERQGIVADQWQVLRNTGTNHLMAIAGLHIGIMAMFFYTLVNWLWRRSYRLTLSLPAQQAGAIAAFIIACLYSALAGFSIPTQRAFIMLTIITIVLLARRQMSAWRVWALTMLCVLLLNPLSVLIESFWLSFGTIALIIYGMDGRLHPSGGWWKWGRVQWVIGLGLMPVTLALFQECSLVSFAANTIAIPWLGFFILPCCLLSSVFLFILPSVGAWLLWVADKSLAGLWCVLTWFSQHSFAVWHHAVPDYFILILAIIGCLLLLIPIGMPGRWLGLFWLAPLVLYVPDQPARGDIWLTLLDVGQGLAVVVRTERHTLVYDVGAKYNEMDMGERIVVPYLRLLGVQQVDELVISHGDNDHMGGLSALLNNVAVQAIHTSVPEKITMHATLCMRQSWHWDGVNFTFLYPNEEELGLGNDSSCVLRIDNGEYAILLTGDIEKYAEQVLLAHEQKLTADLLIAPHHGSKTSVSADFVKAVHPQWVLYSTGYHNRYHFPHAKVIAAYATIHAQQFNSTQTGTLQIKFQHGKKSIWDVYRVSHARYWMEQCNEYMIK